MNLSLQTVLANHTGITASMIASVAAQLDAREQPLIAAALQGFPVARVPEALKHVVGIVRRPAALALLADRDAAVEHLRVQLFAATESATVTTGAQIDFNKHIDERG